MSDAAMIVAGAIACMGLAGAGSAFGTGFASAAAVGAWKKCYAANKPAPFLLLTFVGAPITQVLYGMIVMNKMLDFLKTPDKVAGLGLPLLVAGIFAGLAIGLSALFRVAPAQPRAMRRRRRTRASPTIWPLSASSRRWPSSRSCSRTSPSARSRDGWAIRVFRVN